MAEARLRLLADALNELNEIEFFTTTATRKISMRFRRMANLVSTGRDNIKQALQLAMILLDYYYENI